MSLEGGERLTSKRPDFRPLGPAKSLWLPQARVFLSAHLDELAIQRAHSPSQGWRFPGLRRHRDIIEFQRQFG